MREVVEAAVAEGATLDGHEFWGIEPDAFGEAAKPPTFVVDVREWVPRKLAALSCHRTQMGPEQSVRADRRRDRPGGCSGSSISAARRPKAAGSRSSNRWASRCRAHEHRHVRHPALPVLRRPARPRHVVVSPHQRRRDPRRHPRLPVLRLPGRGRHSGHAPAAGGDGGARARRAGTARTARRRAMFGLDDERRGRQFDDARGLRHRHVPQHRRRARASISRAATFSTASRIRPTSSATPSSGRWPARCSAAAGAPSTSAAARAT